MGGEPRARTHPRDSMCDIIDAHRIQRERKKEENSTGRPRIRSLDSREPARRRRARLRMPRYRSADAVDNASRNLRCCVRTFTRFVNLRLFNTLSIVMRN